jgi:hypothetical protein
MMGLLAFDEIALTVNSHCLSIYLATLWHDKADLLCATPSRWIYLC